jgi:ribosomal protein S18 acetylase RimI-like enzyme
LAKDADAPAIVTLVNAAYRGTASRRGWTSEEHLISGERINAEVVLGILRDPESIILLMRGQSHLNACAHLKKQPNGLVYLGLLTVRPAMQGSQFGRHMLAAAERYSREHLGAKTVEMTVVNLREELIAWYERRGYVRTGEIRPFPYEDKTLGEATRDDLAFIVLRRTIA